MLPLRRALMKGPAYPLLVLSFLWSTKLQGAHMSGSINFKENAMTQFTDNPRDEVASDRLAIEPGFNQ